MVEQTVNQRIEFVLNSLIQTGELDSFAALAEEMGYKSKGNITNIVKGEQQPTIALITHLATKYKVNTSYILLGTDQWRNHAVSTTSGANENSDNLKNLPPAKKLTPRNRPTAPPADDTDVKRLELIKKLRDVTYKKYREKIDNDTPMEEMLGDLDLRLFLIENGILSVSL